MFILLMFFLLNNIINNIGGDTMKIKNILKILILFLLVTIISNFDNASATSNAWIYEENNTYYYENGNKVKGFHTIDGKVYFFSNSNSALKTGLPALPNRICRWRLNSRQFCRFRYILHIHNHTKTHNSVKAITFLHLLPPPKKALVNQKSVLQGIFSAISARFSSTKPHFKVLPAILPIKKPARFRAGSTSHYV